MTRTSPIRFALLLVLSAAALAPAAASAQVDPGIICVTASSKAKASDVQSVVRPDMLETALDEAAEWLLGSNSKWLPSAQDAINDFVNKDLSAVEGVEFGYEAPVWLAAVEGVEFGYETPAELSAALQARLAFLPIPKHSGIELIFVDGFLVSAVAFDPMAESTLDAGFATKPAGALSTDDLWLW